MLYFYTLNNLTYLALSFFCERLRNLRLCAQPCTFFSEDVNSIRFSSFPTDSYKISVPGNLVICEFYVFQEHCAADFRAPKLLKGMSGSVYLLMAYFKQR